MDLTERQTAIEKLLIRRYELRIDIAAINADRNEVLAGLDEPYREACALVNANHDAELAPLQAEIAAITAMLHGDVPIPTEDEG